MRAIAAALPMFLMLVLLLEVVDARQLQQKTTNKPKPASVTCPEVGPTTMDNMNAWPAECMGAKPLGFSCKGTCHSGYVGSPTAVCQGKSGTWATNGGCKLAHCDADDLPPIANATWANCDKAAVGSTCTAQCDGILTQSADITVTCQLEQDGKGASWTSTFEYCGPVITQALLNFQASAPEGRCDADATAAVKQSVETFMASQTDVKEMQAVQATCYNSDGTKGAEARRLLEEPAQSSVRYVVVVVYVGNETAAMNLVAEAESDLNKVGNLINAVSAATDGQITVTQSSATGDYTGGGNIPLNPSQDAKVSLLRSKSGKSIQTQTSFYLMASYIGVTGFAQEGVVITGPTVEPAEALTCTPIAPAPLTDIIGTATWACSTGGTNMTDVTISVEAPNPYSNTNVTATTTFDIGTDCVGAWGDWTTCDNVCGQGEITRLYEISVEAANGGRACPYAAGANETQSCTGPTVCDPHCQECDKTACVNKAAETECPNKGMCFNGVCQPGNKLFEVKSVSPVGTIPASNTEFVFLRLFNAGTASAGVVALVDESGRSTPAAVNNSIVEQAPADPRDPTGATPLTTAFAMMNTGSTDRVEAALFYRNNTPNHPPGLFNGMKFTEFLNNNGTLSMSWYRGDWASMTVGSAPIFRFTLQNPAKPTGRVEFIWEPAYDYDNKVPTNGWRTETVSFSQGELSVWMDTASGTDYGARGINCYLPLSFWTNPASRCSTNPKPFPWFGPNVETIYGTTDFLATAVITEVRVSALNPKSLAYANNIKFSTDNGYQFTYVFTN